MITKEYLERLNNLDNEKLIDIVKNYRQYGYTKELREQAILRLNKRGIHKKELQLKGEFENETYNTIHELYTSFRKNSKITFILYSILLIVHILIPVFFRNIESLIIMTIILSWIVLMLFFLFLIKTFINQHQFYKFIGKNREVENIFVYLFLGMPLYIVMYFYFIKKMKEEMNEIS